MMPNTPQYLAVMIGIVRAGYILVNVNPLYTAHELEHQLNDSEAKVLFIVENFAHTFEKVVNKGQIQQVIITGIGDMMRLKGLLINAVVRHVKKMVPNYCIPNKIKFKDILNKNIHTLSQVSVWMILLYCSTRAVQQVWQKVRC